LPVLKETFIQLIGNYTTDARLGTQLWNEIETNYSNKKRHYHTLTHLENLLQQLLAVKTKIKDWDTVLFTLYYHDIIYNPLKTTNEEKSAEFAQNRMQLAGIPQPIIDNCVNQILATKKHILSTDSDTNFFTDADLCILGQPWEMYEQYYKQVRKEYTLYPELIYNPGRKKVLQHFLQMKPIFKTDYFFEHFEGQAKENLEKELQQL
jgi:predicted metal-dependent HD superfamily phosphohydrolase